MWGQSRLGSKPPSHRNQDHLQLGWACGVPQGTVGLPEWEQTVGCPGTPHSFALRFPWRYQPKGRRQKVLRGVSASVRMLLT